MVCCRWHCMYSKLESFNSNGFFRWKFFNLMGRRTQTTKSFAQMKNECFDKIKCGTVATAAAAMVTAVATEMNVVMLLHC